MLIKVFIINYFIIKFKYRLKMSPYLHKIKDKDDSIDLNQLGVYYNQAKIIEDDWVHNPWD